MAGASVAPPPPEGGVRRPSLGTYLQRLIWTSMLPLLAVAVYLAVDTVQQLRASDDRAMNQLAGQVASDLDQFVRVRMDALAALSRSPLLDDPRLLGDFHRAAQSIRRTFGDHLILVDGAGRMLLHTGQAVGSALPALPPPGLQDAVPRAIGSGKPETGDRFNAPLDNEPAVAIAVPVPADAGASAPGRVLVAVIPVRRLQQLAEQVPLPAGWSVRVVDSQRQLLAARPPLPAGSAPAPDEPGLRLARTSVITPWTVTLEGSAQSRAAPLWHAAQVLLLAIAGATLAGWLAGAQAGRRLARSVAALADSGADPAAAGSIAEIAAVHQRLTQIQDQREQAAAAMRASEATLRAVFDGLPDAALLSDDQHRIRLVNPAFERQFGLAAAAVLGRDARTLGADADDAADAADAAGSATPGQPAPEADEQRFRRADGSVFWAETTLVQLVDAGGQPRGSFRLLRDVSLRRERREDLRRQREALEQQVTARTAELRAAVASLEDSARFNRTITDNLPVRITYWDAELRCRFANRTFLQWIGLPQEAVLGRLLPEVLSAEPMRQAAPHAEAALRGERRSFHISLGSADTSQLHDLVYLPDQRAGEAVQGFFAMGSDITALQRAEAELRALNTDLAAARDAAEAATRAKSAFLANMSHEIRTPMNAIIGLSHLMGRDTQDPLQRERLGKIDVAAHHLLQVINDVLDLSKIEAGKMVLEDVAFPTDTLIERALEMVRAQAAASGLALIADTARLPAWLRGDPTRLARALINLLSNAVKFTARGWVRLRAEVLAEDAQQLLVRFEVTDTGSGIPAEQQQRLFQPFEQGDSGISRRHGGTGLGLALTQHLAGLMGGEAGLSSQPGAGSRVWFTARLHRVAQPPDAASPRPAWPARSAEARLLQDHGGQRVLLAEDNAVNREVAVELLSRVGLVVETAEDGQRAQDLALQRPFDLVLMDMQMPVVDGLAASRAIRQRIGPALPIIAMTANAFAEDRAACLAAGMDDHLAKPVNPEQLYAVLLRWLPAAAAAPPGQGGDNTGGDAGVPAIHPALAPIPAPVPAPAMADRLADIDGLDLPAALANVGGDLPMVGRVMRRFVQTYRAAGSGLAAGADPQRWAPACHSLRGACSAIGATALAAAAAALEQALAGHADPVALRPQVQQLQTALDTLVQRLDAVVGA